MMRRRFSKEHGQAVVEFALLTPFLLAFILLIIDSGLLAFSYVSASNAVREGARCGTVGGTSDAIAGRVSGTYNGVATSDPATVSYDDGSGNPVSVSNVQIGDNIKVTAHYDYTWMTLAFVPGLPDVSFDKSTTMRMETTQITKGCP